MLSLYMFCVLIGGALAFPEGAPVAHCQDMTPNHYQSKPQTTHSPFSIEVGKVIKDHNSYKVNVTIKSHGQTYRGFLLEARESLNGPAIGTWKSNVANTKTLDCFNKPSSAITHSTSTLFKDSSFLWSYPLSNRQPKVEFVATIVQSFSVFYMNQLKSISLV